MQAHTLSASQSGPVTARERIIGSVLLLAALAACASVAFASGHYARVANSVLIYVMLGVGLNIMIGYVGLLDLGFVGFYAVGAYTCALLASPQLGLHLPFLLILPAAIVLGALAGVLLGIPVLRLRGDYLAIVTLGFGEIIRIILNNLDSLTNGPQGISQIDHASLFGWSPNTPQAFFWLLLGITLLVIYVVYRLEHSILGKAWAAIREDQDAARSIGINTTSVKLWAFAISAAIGSLTGVLFATSQRYVSPDSFSLNESVLIVLMIVIGGVGNVLGVIVGTLILVLLPEVLRGFAEYRMLLLGLFMVVLVILRPQGLVSRRYGIDRLLKSVLPR